MMRRDEICAWLCAIAVLMLFVSALANLWAPLVVSAVAALGFMALALREGP
jgi:hypothetical protein